MNIDSLIFQGLIFAILNTLICKIINKTLITASFAYWSGWLVLLILTKKFIKDDLIPDFGSLSLHYVALFHQVSFVGFFLGSIVNINFSKKSINVNRLDKILILSSNISNGINRYLIYILIIGSILFINKVRTHGFNLDFFTNVRADYNERNFNFLNWIGIHLSVIVSTLIIVQGINDGFKTLNIKKLFKIILFSAPLYLSSGTRTFLIFPIINYFSSFILFRSFLSRYGKSIFIKFDEIKKILKLTGIMLVVFSLIGFVRGGYGSSFDLFYVIAAWPVSTSFALESWLFEAIYSDGTNGLLTFDWFSNFFHRVGIIDFSQEKNELINIDYYFKKTGNPASVIPRSMIPDLIFDFGKDSFIIATLIITSISQYISIRFIGISIVKHFLATLFFIAMFMTIQDSIFSPGFVVSLFWVIVINFFTNKKLNKKLPLINN